MNILNPLTGKEEPIRAVLRSLASQEGCDGAPYDQMQIASDYIERLEEFANTVHNLSVSKADARFKLDIIHHNCDKLLGHTQ